MNKEKMSHFISAVFYIYNNESIIEQTLHSVHDILSNFFKKFEIICVNDSSTDGSIDAVCKFAKSINDCPVSVVNMGYFHGVEKAIKAGVDLAIGDFVLEFDDALIDFDPLLIISVFEKSQTGYDIVNARPLHAGNGISRLFYKIFNHFSLEGQKLGTERFHLITRRAINRVDSISKSVFYRKAVYASCGLKSAVVPYENSKVSSAEFNQQQRKMRRKTAFDSLVLFTSIAYKISFVSCILMVCFMLSTGIYTVVIYFGQSRPVSGWAPLMGLISAGFSVMFGILTIIIKYLDLILNLVFQKQQYLIASIQKLR